MSMIQELDMALWNSIKDGDAKAFELLFKKYYASLCLFAVKYTNDMDSAREVVQNLFVYLWENRTTVNIAYSIKSYLTSATRRNSIRLVEQRRPFVPIDTLHEDTHIADELHDSLELEELNQQLNATIEKLPDKCKQIFKMNRFDEMTYSEIARKLNISVKTVEAQMGKALKFLRSKIK